MSTLLMNQSGCFCLLRPPEHAFTLSQFCSAVHSGSYGFSSRSCVKTNLVAVLVPGGPNLCVCVGGGGGANLV